MSDDVDVTKEDLTDKQIELLEMIREDPDATQKEFAEELGVTPAAVGSRVRQIPGMNWMSRRWYVKEFFDGQGAEKNEVGDPADPTSEEKSDDLTNRIEELENRLENLSERIDEIEDDPERSGITEPDLIRKLVLTVTNSDRFTEGEGDQLLRILIE